MLGIICKYGFARRVFLAVLSLLFALAPLTALAAQAFAASPGGMACCRTRNRCCCHKDRTSGVAIVGNTCSDGCNVPSLAGFSLSADAPVPVVRTSAASVSGTVTAAASQDCPPAPLLSTLHPRPPPAA